MSERVVTAFAQPIITALQQVLPKQWALDRLDADVLAFFKAQGRGYLTRINNELRKVAAKALPARAHLETSHLTKSRANARRLRGAHAEIEAEIARRKRQAA